MVLLGLWNLDLSADQTTHSVFFCYFCSDGKNASLLINM